MKKLNQIEQIACGGEILKKESDLEKFIEEPIKKAVLDLWKKNIRTIESGCNSENNSNAYIIIDYDLLSNENKEIADSLFSEHKNTYNRGLGEINTINLNISTTSDSLVTEIETKIKIKTSLFKKQKLNWGFQDFNKLLKNGFGIDQSDLSEKEKDDFVKSMGGIWDKESNLLFESKGLYEKWKNS